MARIQQADTGARFTATLGGVRSPDTTSAFSRASGVLQQGARDIQRSAANVADEVVDTVTDMQSRRNERMVQDAMLAFEETKSTILRGDGSPDTGMLNMRGSDADGVTRKVGLDLRNRLEELQRDFLENDVQRQEFLRVGQGVMLTTADTMAQHEARELENRRQSNALALRTKRRETLTVESPELMLDDARVAQEVEEFEDYISAQMPDLGDEAVALAARQELAETAVEATFSLLERGMGGVGPAQAMLDKWGDKWDSQTRGAVLGKIQHEFGYGIMDDSVRLVAKSLGQQGSPFTASEIMGDFFKDRFKEMTNEDPPDEMVQEAKRRAGNFYRQLDADINKRQDEADTALMSSYFQVMSNPQASAEDREAAYQNAWKNANPTTSERVYKTLAQVKQNFAETGGTFRKNTTVEGAQLLAQVDSSDFLEMDAATVLANATNHMSASDGKAYINAHQNRGSLGTTLPSADQIGKAVDLAYQQSGDGVPDKKNGARGVLIGQLTSLASDFAATNSRKPDINELSELARGLRHDLNDFGSDAGASGNIGDFLTNPTGEGLSPNNKKDRMLLQMVTDFLEADERVKGIVYDSAVAEGRNAKALFSAPEQLGAYLVAKPELVAEIIKFGIVRRTRRGTVGLTPVVKFQQQLRGERGLDER